MKSIRTPVSHLRCCLSVVGAALGVVFETLETVNGSEEDLSPNVITDPKSVSSFLWSEC